MILVQGTQQLYDHSLISWGSMVVIQSEPEAARDVASRDNGVNWRFISQFTPWATLKTHGLSVASKRARRLATFQTEASPQQAESLAAAVQASSPPIYTDLTSEGA